MRGDTAPPVTRILVPTDFSPGSEAALSLAQRLARALGADLVLLHVLDRTPLDVETKVRHEEHEAQRRLCFSSGRSEPAPPGAM